MIALLLSIAVMVVQGVPLAPNQGGTVTGLLRTTTGTPAAGVRVSALAKPDEIKDLSQASSLAGIAETDAAGRFRLENIPPGRYYIVAGRIDLPTYYPGVVDANEGVVILVTPGITVPGIDFALSGVSAGRAVSAGTVAPRYVIAVQARVENGKVPIFAGGKFPVLRLTRPNSAPIETSLVDASLTVPNTDYRATIDSIPDGYTLKSFTYGSTDLTTNPLQLATTALGGGGIGTPTPTLHAISVVLQRSASAPLAGARISGRIRGDTNRSIYISGSPGAIYADGTFEFIGVPPGRHSIVTYDNPGSERPLAALVIVGDRDFPNVELQRITATPLALGGAAGPAPAGNRAANTHVPLSTIRGQVLDGMTGQPLDAGRVVVNNNHSQTFTLSDDGRFEIPRLLPGNYTLQIAAYSVGTVDRTVVLDEQDAVIEVRIDPDP
ncbi:MAG TPA: carboxypeptidase-like regulatory domain-containing protein [Terriglobia bacterium]|nr:carboxypeptidase-like regulatory domain-containing protein [Terriglobia bacterium]